MLYLVFYTEVFKKNCQKVHKGPICIDDFLFVSFLLHLAFCAIYSGFSGGKERKPSDDAEVPKAHTQPHIKCDTFGVTELGTT